MRGWNRNALLVSSAIVSVATATPAAAQTKSFDVPAQSVQSAVTQLGRQADIQIIAARSVTRGTRSTPVRGNMTVEQALSAMLQGTGLTFRQTGPQTFTVIAVPRSSEAKASGQTASSSGDDDARDRATPEILVTGKRSINADIQRTEDDVQPYVVLDSEEVKASNATTVEDFLRTRLPMNTLSVSTGQISNNAFGSTSQVNLRGLGTNQTLILLDGRRMPGIVSNGFRQPDINGIPLNSIERIEILPATASGIYGGGATGGVINIVTRKDYEGIDANVTYGSSFRGDASNLRVDLSGGFKLEGGKTRITFAASHVESDPLLVGGRDFSEKSRLKQFTNNPSSFNASTPLAYTPNIRNRTGANLVLDNGTALNSNITHVPIGYAGVAGDGGAALIANAGRHNLDLSNDLGGLRQGLLSGPTIDSVSANVRREFGDNIEAFVDFAWLRNRGKSFSGGIPNFAILPANAPGNPFTTDITVSFPAPGISLPITTEAETFRVVGGILVRLGKGWTAGIDYLWSQSDFSGLSTFPSVGDPDGPTGPGVSFDTAVANGTLNVIRDLNQFPLNYSPYLLPSPNQLTGPNRSRLDDVTLRLSGPVLDLPGGPLMLTTSAEYRRERAFANFFESMNASAVGSVFYTSPASQQVYALYGELRAPLIADRPLLHELELLGSVRHDRYKTTAASPTSATVPSRDGPLPTLTFRSNEVQSTSFTLGLRYAPTADLTFRASYGTGFLPPAVQQIVPNPPVESSTSIADPKRGSTLTFVGPITFLLGGNPNLEPETSKSLSIGAVLTPRFLKGLRLSVDYTRIKKSNEILQLFTQDLVNLEDTLPGRVIRDPLTPEDQARGFTGGVIRTINGMLLNVQGTQVTAFDFQADYSFDLSPDAKVRIYSVATYQPDLERQQTAAAPVIDIAGFNQGGLGVIAKWRGNAGITVDAGGLTFGWNAQFYGSYFLYPALSSTPTASQLADRNQRILSNGAERIPSQFYHDLFVKYRFGQHKGDLLNGLELSLGVQNVFDKKPPILASAESFSSNNYSTFGDPRLRRFTVSARKSF